MLGDVSTNWKLFVAIAVLWELAWKGLALWRASHRDQPRWFISLLVINTVGLLPILYLLTHPSIENTKK